MGDISHKIGSVRTRIVEISHLGLVAIGDISYSVGTQQDC